MFTQQRERPTRRKTVGLPLFIDFVLLMRLYYFGAT
jgi:hypothetical protein